MVVFTRITVAQAATVINAFISFIQHTLGLCLVAILIYAIPKVNPAVGWSVISRIVQTSFWPSLLRTDASASRSAGICVAVLSKLLLLGIILVAVTGIVTPLGLKDGPIVQSGPVLKNAAYVPDASPLGLATSPRNDYAFTRICGSLSPMPCPGNGNNGNTSEIAASTVKAFSSTPYGPFSMQFRQYYNGTGGYNYTMLRSSMGAVQSLILRDGIFAVEGLVVDLGDNPGIGLWNHTLPDVKRGGVWSQEMLWLEPVTTCVNTNLTIDYELQNNADDPLAIEAFNLTDRGGFVNLTHEYPYLSLDGQNVNLYEHAYKGAVISNFYTMQAFNNMTRNESYIGKTFPLKRTNTSFTLGRMGPVDLTYLESIAYNTSSSISTICQGYGGADTANATNIGVHCRLYLGPPSRSDNGDPRLPGDNSTWSQSLHACASVTRARSQIVEFTFDGESDLTHLQISRRNTSSPVLWAIEKTDALIRDVDLFWGRVDNSYENDPSLTILRSEILYLPAGSSDSWGVPGSGNPSTVLPAAWSKVYNSLTTTSGYSGEGNFALLTKFQSLMSTDPAHGASRIQNMIWTDMVANNLVGSMTSTTLLVNTNKPSISYDLKYGIPALLLVLLWLPTFVIAVFLFARGSLTLHYMRHVLNHTSVGRIVVGDSDLGIVHGYPESHTSPNGSESEGRYQMSTAEWAKTTGCTPVAFGHGSMQGFLHRQESGAEQKELLSPTN